MLVLCVFLGSFVNAGESITIFTAPKSGTHLLQRFLSLLIDKKIPFPYGNCENAEHNFLFVHSDFFLSEPTNLEKYPKRLLLIRDPRDVCVSWVNFVDTSLTPEKKEVWLNLSFNKKLMHTIRMSPKKAFKENKLDGTFISYPILPYEDALTLSKLTEGKTLICKFENLVGPQGGGSEKLQREEALKIIRFLGLSISSEKLDDILSNLFGNSNTFHKAQIGRWKKVFTKKHKKVFKKKRNSLLIEFGYETDDKW